MALVLGINAFHADSSACLLSEGRLVAAAEEERFRRVKHWAGLPVEAVKYCLAQANAKLSDVSYIAINEDDRANLLRKLLFVLRRQPQLRAVLGRVRQRQHRGDIAKLLEQELRTQYHGQMSWIEHHRAHLASAFYTSAFEQAVALSIDGFGDFASSAWGVGRGTALNVDDRIYFPHSLGVFYQAITQFLGFREYGDEYKIMGLASYGEPRFMPQMRQLVSLQPSGHFELGLRYFRHHREHIEYQWIDSRPVIATLYSPEISELLGAPRAPEAPLEQRHLDIAKSAQTMYERAFFNLLHSLHTRYAMDAIVLAGGCAMNSVANGKVFRESQFKRIHVQAAASDAGGAIGAALECWHRLYPVSARVSIDHAYWGPSFSDEECRVLLERCRSEILAQHCNYHYVGDEEVLCARVAAQIAQGLVVGWFQGRMEWGQRALGNRSILGDPRRADIRDLVNLKIKRRENFRPFAPSVLRQHVAQWFEEDADAPFMMQVHQVRPEKRAMIPAVTHIDGSGRLQTVCAQTNPRYYRLISSFARLTDVPMLLNTSFNDNEPIVCRPEEALSCFLRTRMDVLVLGNYHIQRQPA